MLRRHVQYFTGESFLDLGLEKWMTCALLPFKPCVLLGGLNHLSIPGRPTHSSLSDRIWTEMGGAELILVFEWTISMTKTLSQDIDDLVYHVHSSSKPVVLKTR